MEGLKLRPVVIIPAYQPGRGLVPLVKALLADPDQYVVIVDDGSTGDCLAVFARLPESERLHLLRHSANLGKGAALKTAFHFVLSAFPPQVVGVVTADADGQHLLEDIRQVAANLLTSPDQMILGSREFASDVPLRSRAGNIITRNLFHFLVGYRLTDTQTGLRGIPRGLIPGLLESPYSRYDFELDMLIRAHRLGYSVVETQFILSI